MAERSKNGPYWVKAWIADLSQLTDMFRDEDGKVDYDALGREEYQFRMALARKDFSLSSRAKKVWDEALGPYKHRISAALKDKESTADGETREGSQNVTDGSNAAQLESATSATITQDASTRKGEDDCKARTSCTVSSSSPSVRPSLAYAGRGGNVRLTDDEYAMLLQELGNKRKADKLIDSLDYAISEGKTFNAPHFHVLMHWNDYREEKAEQRAKDMKVKAEAFAEASKKQGFKSNADKMDEMMAGAKHLIDMYRLPEVKNG